MALTPGPYCPQVADQRTRLPWLRPVLLSVVVILSFLVTSVSSQQEWDHWEPPWKDFDNAVVVRTYYGDVRGFSVPWHVEDEAWNPEWDEQPRWYVQRVNCFLGFPYAEAPLGRLRFQVSKHLQCHPLIKCQSSPMFQQTSAIKHVCIIVHENNNIYIYLFSWTRKPVKCERPTLEVILNRQPCKHHILQCCNAKVLILATILLLLQRPIRPRWGGTYEANYFRPSCPQRIEFIRENIPDYPRANVSEDCLYMNVFAPNITWHSFDTLYPVLVFIHGGGFVNGTSQIYPGQVLVRQEIVVVTFNYRLGALGECLTTWTLFMPQVWVTK